LNEPPDYTLLVEESRIKAQREKERGRRAFVRLAELLTGGLQKMNDESV
jgi:hypothetical protein